MNPIVKLAASALPGEKKYVLFAGAGGGKNLRGQASLIRYFIVPGFDI